MSDQAQRVQLGPFMHNGEVQGGAKLYHFEAGTTTLKGLWEDRAKSITLAQPLVADADGVFNFFADGNYKLVLCEPDSTGPTHLVLYTLDNFSFLDPTDIQLAKGTAINASSTMSVGPEIWAHVIGSGVIGALTGTIPFWWAVFDGNNTLTHSANFVMPSSVNRRMYTGDVGFFLNEGAGVWRLAGHMESNASYNGRQGTAYTATATLAVPQDGDLADVTGSDVDITGISPRPAGYKFVARFTGSGCQLVHHDTALICPHTRDYRIIQNELIEFRSLGSGNWLVCFRSGPTESPGTFKDVFATIADDGYYHPIGQALNATRHMALAKRCIPKASTIGIAGTDLGTVTFENSTETWTLVAHGLVNGDIVHLSNSGGGLPNGYTADTVYHVVNAGDDTFKLALTRGGAAVDGSTNGTGTHTVHDEFKLPDVRGYIRAALDNLGGSTLGTITSASTNGANSIVLGGKFGTQTHVLTIDELPSNSPTHLDNADGGGQKIPYDGGAAGGHSNTQPSIVVGVQIRW